jgi:hypothetical protein
MNSMMTSTRKRVAPWSSNRVLAALVIVFREVFEAGLIVGIVRAAVQYVAMGQMQTFLHLITSSARPPEPSAGIAMLHSAGRCNVADGGSPNSARWATEKRPSSQKP